MSDERTITRAVGLLLAFVFVVILILGAISFRGADARNLRGE